MRLGTRVFRDSLTWIKSCRQRQLIESAVNSDPGPAATLKLMRKPAMAYTIEDSHHLNIKKRIPDAVG